MSDFAATSQQRMAKATFQKKLSARSELALVPSQWTKSQLVEFVGLKRMAGWMEEEGFIEWFLDEYALKVKILAAQEAALDQLLKIIDMAPTEKNLKDKVNAAVKLLELGGSFPSRSKEVVILDKDLAALTSADTKKQIQEMERSRKLRLSDAEAYVAVGTEEDEG